MNAVFGSSRGPARCAVAIIGTIAGAESVDAACEAICGWRMSKFPDDRDKWKQALRLEAPNRVIRHHIRIFDAKDTKVVDSETTRTAERAMNLLVRDSALAPGYRGRQQSTFQPAAATAGAVVLAPEWTSMRVGLTVPRIVFARAISAAGP
jgi:hypothetical protein